MAFCIPKNIFMSQFQTLTSLNKWVQPSPHFTHRLASYFQEYLDFSRELTVNLIKLFQAQIKLLERKWKIMFAKFFIFSQENYLQIKRMKLHIFFMMNIHYNCVYFYSFIIASIINKLRQGWVKVPILKVKLVLSMHTIFRLIFMLYSSKSFF